MIAFRAVDFAVFLFGFASNSSFCAPPPRGSLPTRRRSKRCRTRRTFGCAEMTKETKQAFAERFAREMTETADGNAARRRFGRGGAPMRELNRAPTKRSRP
jgi:hypothetical protein